MEKPNGQEEMETGTPPPKPPRLTSDENALVLSQVLEIIGGISREALRSLEEPEERDVWSVEEGDDSVFYSDEDQAHQNVKANTNGDSSSADKGEQLVKNVVADDEPSTHRVYGPGEELEMKKEEGTTWQVLFLSEQEEEHQELQSPKTEPMDQSHPADPGAQSNLDPEESPVSTCGESLQLQCTIADTQTPPGQSVSAEKANVPVEEEDELMLESKTPSLEHVDEMSSAELQISGDGQIQVDRELQQYYNVHAPPVAVHQNPRLAYASLPLPKKSGQTAGQQKTFNHLSSSKYDTVSYRKIRRGNTRQKIEEFEYKTMNL